MTSVNPDLVLVFSGKRKAGKDFITEILSNRLGREHCSCIHLSGPLKKQYAVDHNIDYEKLMDSSSYKEKFRSDMIKWGEEKRKQDPGYFCQLATSSKQLKKIWIICDARRKTDLSYFTEKYRKKTYCVRVTADDDIRKGRGFIFTPGVDDAESECDLDNGVNWNYIVHNNDDKIQLEADIAALVKVALEQLGK